MLRILSIASVLLLALQLKAADCMVSTKDHDLNSKYVINTDVPNHLKGATITITLADGRTSSAPAEQFKVVPRKQQFITKDTLRVSTVTCSPEEKLNQVLVGARHDINGVELETFSSPGIQTAKVKSTKGVVPEVNYVRRKLIGDFGAGVGVDSNGVGKALINFDF